LVDAWRAEALLPRAAAADLEGETFPEGRYVASINEIERKSGTRFKVWYRADGKLYGRTFPSRTEAESFARRVEVQKEDGTLGNPSLGRAGNPPPTQR
jgi:hypothetical protein